MSDVRPKKYLGQHFLISNSIAEKITILLDVDANSLVVEVGPGKGILTDYLFKKWDKRLITIDIDIESVNYLRKKYIGRSKQIIHGDILKTTLEHFNLKVENLKINNPQIKIIGNFPYNISSQIFFYILKNKDVVKEVVCMIQKEVAQRLSAPSGTRQSGILTIFIQLWYDVGKIFDVSRENFLPQPKVESSVIKLVRNKRTSLPVDEDIFKKVVKQAFNFRRKTLKNALKTLNLPADILQEPIFLKRAEKITVEEYINLVKILEPHII